MLTLMFMIALIWVAWKLMVLGLKATWGIAKLICVAFLFPVFLIGLVVAGFIYLAIPILVIVGIISLIRGTLEA